MHSTVCYGYAMQNISYGGSSKPYSLASRCHHDPVRRRIPVPSHRGKIKILYYLVSSLSVSLQKNAIPPSRLPRYLAAKYVMCVLCVDKRDSFRVARDPVKQRNKYPLLFFLYANVRGCAMM
jgi:hypothetical protein